MKTELKKLINKNYKNLAEDKVEEIVNKMCELLPAQKIKLSKLKAGEKFTYEGYEFTKLADEQESCYCLLNDIVFESEFGKTNDWEKSVIRKLLNEFDEYGDSCVLAGINKNDLIPVSLNYYATNIPNGRTTDRITCLSYEESIMYDFCTIDKSSWLRSGYYNSYSSSYLLNSSGTSNNTYVGTSYGLRPSLHFKKDMEVEWIKK